jgi:hypothetical protein
VEHEGIQPTHGAHDHRHRNGVDGPQQRGIEHSIRPASLCPETVLVVVMTDGSYLLMAYPLGEPAAFVIAKDAVPLRRELAAAFGSTPALAGEPPDHQVCPECHSTRVKTPGRDFGG